MPRPVEALPCGSRSMINTCSPMAASAVPRLMAVVVLPTPPFWLATASTRDSRGSASAGKGGHLEHAAGRIAEAGNDLAIEAPAAARGLDLGVGALAFQEEPDPALGQVRAGKFQQF